MRIYLKYFLYGLHLCSFLGITLGLQSCNTGLPPGIQPVDDFDLQRYLGVWHEIARLDHAFERGYDHVTATYQLTKEGRSIEVHNRACRSKDGQCKEVKGRAKFVGQAHTGHLKVSFWRPFYSSYVVFYVEPDYSVALVCGASRKYCWILARDPKMSPEVLEKYLDVAERHGFKRDAFILQHK